MGKIESLFTTELKHSFARTGLFFHKIADMPGVDMFLPGHGDVGMRDDVLDEANMLAEVQKTVKAAIAQGMTQEQVVKTLRFPQFANRRNYDRIDVFLEALYHLYTTGKPLFPYP